MSFENYSTTGAICPYCGHEHEANGDNYELFSERTDTWTCNACGDDFSVAVYIQYSWTTEALEDRP